MIQSLSMMVFDFYLTSFFFKFSQFKFRSICWIESFSHVYIFFTHLMSLIVKKELNQTAKWTCSCLYNSLDPSIWHTTVKYKIWFECAITQPMGNLFVIWKRKTYCPFNVFMMGHKWECKLVMWWSPFTSRTRNCHQNGWKCNLIM